jgi:signal transduction histidine kinase
MSPPPDEGNWLRLLSSVIVAVTEATDVDSGLGLVLQKIGEGAGWAFVQAWVPRPDGLLHCGPHWFGSPGLEPFRALSQATTFAPGAGLPGLAWSSKEPVWMRDVTLDKNFPRAPGARQVGLKAGVAIPVLYKAEVVAVVELFAKEVLEEDQILVRGIRAVAAEVIREVTKRVKVEEQRLQLAAAEQAARDAREQARTRQILAEASHAFARAVAAHDHDAILRETARCSVELVGDTCLVIVLTESPSELEVSAFYDREPEARAVADRLLVGRRLPRVCLDAKVLDSGVPLLVSSMEPREVRATVGAAYDAILERFPAYGLIAVPLLTRQGVSGVVSMSRHAPGAPYTEVDLALLRDVVDRAALAADNIRLHRDLLAAIQARDDILAAAGHELKTPLTVLLMQLQGLQRSAQRDPTKIGDRLAKAGQSGLRLERLINQLLDVSRITAGRLRLEPECFDLSALVREVVQRFADAAAPPQCPIFAPCAEPVDGNWDRLRIDQVVSNLVGNAVKYGQAKSVEVSLHIEGSHAVLRVTDHGIGIDDQHRDRIFQRFERAVANRDFGGFGLGLWIARQIVEASGGAIEVASVLGQGSTFTVRLPLNRDHAGVQGRHAGQ